MKSKIIKGNLRVFVTIPESLKHITDKDSLIIINYIFHQIKFNESLFGKWVPFSKARGLSVSKNYLKALKSLMNAGIIERSCHEDEDGKKTYYSKERGIVQHFRFTEMQWDLIRDGENHCASFSHIFRINKVERESYFMPDYYSDIKKMVGSVYNELPLDGGEYWCMYLNEQKEKFRSFLKDKISYQSILNKDFRISVGNSGRVYHPMVTMEKKLRSTLTVKGESLIEVDAKSLHPYLLGHFANTVDKERWIAVLSNGDFYERFTDSKNDRDDIKRVFQKAISYSPDGYGKKSLEIQEFIRTIAPSILGWLESCWNDCLMNGNEGNTVQIKLQSVESEIFIQQAFRKLCDARIWTFPQHDGFACRERDVQAVGAILDECLQAYLGFRIPLDRGDSGDILNPVDCEKEDLNLSGVYSDVFENGFQLMGDRWLYLSDGVWVDSDGNCELE